MIFHCLFSSEFWFKNQTLLLQLNIFLRKQISRNKFVQDTCTSQVKGVLSTVIAVLVVYPAGNLIEIIIFLKT